MPIYAYKCSACQHAQDVLQKMSDPLLTVCPSCGQSTYVKQVTAAAFQLKGTGWYVTDFRDNGNKPDQAVTGAPVAAVNNSNAPSTDSSASSASASTTSAPAAASSATSTPAST